MNDAARTSTKDNRRTTVTPWSIGVALCTPCEERCRCIGSCCSLIVHSTTQGRVCLRRSFAGPGSRAWEPRSSPSRQSRPRCGAPPPRPLKAAELHALVADDDRAPVCAVRSVTGCRHRPPRATPRPPTASSRRGSSGARSERLGPGDRRRADAARSSTARRAPGARRARRRRSPRASSCGPGLPPQRRVDRGAAASEFTKVDFTAIARENRGQGDPRPREAQGRRGRGEAPAARPRPRRPRHPRVSRRDPLLGRRAGQAARGRASTSRSARPTCWPTQAAMPQRAARRQAAGARRAGRLSRRRRAATARPTARSRGLPAGAAHARRTTTPTSCACSSSRGARSRAARSSASRSRRA